jgi:act minimal PKS acyl carrier protein
MATQQFTLDDLKRMLRAAAGEEDDSDNLGSDILDMGFEELGYDSLAMLETSRCIELECGITLDDDTVTTAATPRAMLELVNGELAAKQVL